jgi:anaerobic selenocysteine-containing dehydrogenase
MGSSDGTVTRITSYCRMCPAACGVLVDVADGAIVKLTGDPDHLLSRGYVCPKGRRMVSLVDDPARLDQPMMRTSRGELVPVGWETALDDLAARLVRIREEHDGYAIGAFSGTFGDHRGYVDKILREVGSPSSYTSLTIDSVAKTVVPKLMAGQERLWPAMDFDETHLLLVIGENLVVSHGGYSYFPDPVRSLRKVMAHGEVWVVDPRRTETARLATRHLTPRSGTDFALLGYLVRELLRDGADGEYLDARAANVDALRSQVERFDAATTARLSGLAERDLADLVAAVRRHRRLSIITGTGVTMADTGNVTEWLAYALQIVTGSFERPGGRWFNHGATVDPDRAPPAPDPGFGPGPRSHPHLPRSNAQFPCAVLPAEIEQGHLRALMVVGGNPMLAFPAPDRVGRALDQLDVLAVFEIVRSATARRATHVFPSTSPLERADLRFSPMVSAVYAQYTPAVVAPRAERRPSWWALAKLGQKMGFATVPDWFDLDDFDDHDVERLFAAGLDDTPVDGSAVVAAQRPVEYPRRDGWVANSALRGGRWDLAPAMLVERLEHALQREVHPLVLGNRREVHHTNTVFVWPADGYNTPTAHVYLSPHDAGEAGVVDGDLVELTSVHGAVTATARVDPSMARGTVVVPHGFEDVHVGNLTATDVDLDPITGMPKLVGVPVSVKVLVAAADPR